MILTLRTFARWAKKAKVDARKLQQAITAVEQGQQSVKLGSNLLKIRLPVGSQGKRSGARVIIAYRRAQRTIFLYGFEKNERDNITTKEFEALKTIGNKLLSLTDAEIRALLADGQLLEVEEI